MDEKSPSSIRAYHKKFCIDSTILRFTVYYFGTYKGRSFVPRRMRNIRDQHMESVSIQYQSEFRYLLSQVSLTTIMLPSHGIDLFYQRFFSFIIFQVIQATIYFQRNVKCIDLEVSEDTGNGLSVAGKQEDSPQGDSEQIRTRSSDLYPRGEISRDRGN